MKAAKLRNTLAAALLGPAALGLVAVKVAARYRLPHFTRSPQKWSRKESSVK